QVSEHKVVNQRALERGLREKWGERLLSFLLPVANKIPRMAALMPPGTTAVSLELKGEFMDLLGDARFRTLRMRCLSYEELRRLGFTAIPWKESDVRALLNTLRDREVSPHKLQQVWDTLKWLTEKKKSLSETLVSTVHRPMRKALVPAKAFVIQLEETAARAPTGADSRIHLMDSFICGIVRFQIGISARFSDLQHTSLDTLRITSTTVELAAWQTKTHSAVTVKKKPVPLICPKYCFSGKDWWTPLIATWRKLAATPMFDGMDYLIPTVPRDQRQYLGNWMAESTADVYTREKRNVVCAIWDKVTSNLDAIDTDGSRTMKIDLFQEDAPDSHHGGAPQEALLASASERLPVSGAFGPEADSPASSWLVTPLPADEDFLAVGCGWSPSTEKVFPPLLPAGRIPDSLTDDSVDTAASEAEKVTYQDLDKALASKDPP
ncbi:Rbm17, partial [Symbiodinium sp. CCMP2456]